MQQFERFIPEFMREMMPAQNGGQRLSLFHLFDASPVARPHEYSLLGDGNLSIPWLLSSYLIRGVSLNRDLADFDLISPVTSRSERFYCSAKRKKSWTSFADGKAAWTPTLTWCEPASQLKQLIRDNNLISSSSSWSRYIL